MEIENCVLVIKETAYAQGGRAARFAAKGDATARRILGAHGEHNRTVESVKETLARAGIDWAETTPGKFNAPAKKRLARADLVVSVGGDGTALASSHYMRDGVLVGVNSAPGDSIGHFCFANRKNFARLLDDYLNKRFRPLRLARLAVRLDERLLPELTLNDVLIAHYIPAATTRYIIEIGGKSEEHRSSGLWVSTAAGSTAAIRSAGGTVMPRLSRRIQYRARELYREPGRTYNFVKGIIGGDEEIIVASKMPDARLYIDGARTVYQFPFGMRARVKIADSDLKILLARTR